MSSNQKTPLGLNQWEGTDRPQRMDINSDNALVDQILQQKADVVAGKISPMPTVADVGGSNPNLLDNWYFGPGLINQRGKNQYSGAFVYAVDRWATGQNATLTVDSDGVKLFGHEDFQNNYMFQRLEHLAMGTYTFSLLFSENTGQVRISNAYTDNGTVPAPSSTESAGLLSFSFVNAHNMTSSLACFRIHATAQCRPIAVKVELGTTQSLACQEIGGSWVLNDPPPNPALELLKCQRYQFSYFRSDGGEGYTAPLQSHGGTIAYGMLYVPVTLRAFPTILVSDYTRLYHWNPGGINLPIASIRVYGFTNNGVQIEVAFAGQLPPGYAGWIHAAPSPDLLILDANL